MIPLFCIFTTIKIKLLLFGKIGVTNKKHHKSFLKTETFTPILTV